MEGRTVPKGSLGKSHIPSSLKQGMYVNWKWLRILQLKSFSLENDDLLKTKLYSGMN